MLTVHVASFGASSIVNTAVVSGPNPDPEPTNNTSSDTAAVVALYSLSLTKTLDGPLVSGDSAVYTITVANAGPSQSAMPLTLVDNLPSGLVYEHAVSTTPGAWVCTALGRTITCHRHDHRAQCRCDVGDPRHRACHGRLWNASRQHRDRQRTW